MTGHEETKLEAQDCSDDKQETKEAVHDGDAAGTGGQRRGEGQQPENNLQDQKTNGHGKRR